MLFMFVETLFKFVEMLFVFVKILFVFVWINVVTLLIFDKFEDIFVQFALILERICCNIHCVVAISVVFWFICFLLTQETVWNLPCPPCPLLDLVIQQNSNIFWIYLIICSLMPCYSLISASVWTFNIMQLAISIMLYYHMTCYWFVWI